MMASTDKKRLLLLCGSSLLMLQLAATPLGLPGQIVGCAAKAAHAQEISCFVAGTVVLMADGSERPIDSLRPGDAVLGRRGRVNRVVAIECTPLGRRRLYAFNGRRPFVTAEHPFLTSEGWKALDPEATRRENDRLAVTALQLGDRICRGMARRIGAEGGPAEVGRGLLFLQSATMLEALSAVEGDPRTPLFNLLLDGDHSYVADGWIVHNKEGDAAEEVDGAGAPVGGAPSNGGSDTGVPDGGGSAGSSSGGAAATGGADDHAEGTGQDDSPAAESARASGSASDPGPNGPTAAQPPAAATAGASNRPQTGAGKERGQPESARNPSARSVLDAFLNKLGVSNPSDAGLEPTGPPLSREQEQRVIERRWREPE